MKTNVNLLSLFWKFFKIGAFTFGGGFAMIPLIEKEMVNSGWVDKNDIVDLVAISQSIPGAVAINMSLFVGFRIAKKTGAIVAVLGSILPSFLIILIIALFFKNIQNEVIIQRAFTGILSGVVALIIMSAVKVAKSAVMDLPTLLITIGTIILLIFTPVHPIFLIIAGALTGLLFYYLYPKKAREVVARLGGKK